MAEHTTTAPGQLDGLEISHDSEVTVTRALHGGALVTVDGKPYACYSREADADHIAADIERTIAQRVADLGVRMMPMPMPLDAELVRVQWHVPSARFDELLERIAPGKPTHDGVEGKFGRHVDLTLGGVAITMHETLDASAERGVSVTPVGSVRAAA